MKIFGKRVNGHLSVVRIVIPSALLTLCSTHDNRHPTRGGCCNFVAYGAK